MKPNDISLNFKEKAPWWGGDLQTIKNVLWPTIKTVMGTSKRLLIPTKDDSGDQITATLDTPHIPADGPLIILIHGLTGSKNSSYMMATSALQLEQGRQVLRLNLRGAGSSAETCSKHYHGGHISDISDALEYMDDTVKSRGAFLIGYSLGGNILINFLAANNHSDLLGAASVSASIDPQAAALRLMDPRNAIYQSWLIRNMKKEHIKRNSGLTNKQKQIISRMKSIYDFDDKVTAPDNGYRDAKDYYFQTKSARKMQDITSSLLMISARDDPWIPPQSYEMLKQNGQENIKILLTNRGGHVGFHEKGQNETWHDRQINEFMIKCI